MGASDEFDSSNWDLVIGKEHPRHGRLGFFAGRALVKIGSSGGFSWFQYVPIFS